MKGSYVLIIDLAQVYRIQVGRLGLIEFKPGAYAYVGSAMGNLEARISRHLHVVKKIRWHIDYLLQKSPINRVLAIESASRIECLIAGELQKHFRSISGFGCGDCGCPSHLFFNQGPEKIVSVVLKLNPVYKYRVYY